MMNRQSDKWMEGKESWSYESNEWIDTVNKSVNVRKSVTIITQTINKNADIYAIYMLKKGGDG